jgi:16S rRNA (cytidine1402-2'-O)-methyltransferase
LGEAPIDQWLPAQVQARAGGLKTYIAENAKVARAFLKLTPLDHPLQDITIHELNARIEDDALEQWLAPLKAGEDMGLVSDAGCPAVADPGARAVALAHRWGAPVKPWVGPSSILLGLMGSGLDGQRFAFHGYAPVEPAERARQLKVWEQISSKQKQSQLFIETPYRNQAMFSSLTEHLKGNTRLCIARSVTTQDEWIRTLTIAQWKSQPSPALDKHPTLFIFQAA